MSAWLGGASSPQLSSSKIKVSTRFVLESKGKTRQAMNERRVQMNGTATASRNRKCKELRTERTVGVEYKRRARILP
jgi:hypothetical protein